MKNPTIGDTNRRKAIKSLRGQLLRFRKQGKTDEQALAYFAYRTGYPMEVVREFFEILEKAGKINGKN